MSGADTSTKEDDGNYSDDDEASQGSEPKEITKIDLTQERPVEESRFSLQEATKLCQAIPKNVDAQETATLSLLIKAADSAGDVLPVPYQLPHFGFKGYEAAQNLCETSKTLFDRTTQFSFQLDKFHSSLQKLSATYDRRVSKPASVMFKESNLWEALQYIRTTMTLPSWYM